jgi:hypothetical protein
MKEKQPKWRFITLNTLLLLLTLVTIAISVQQYLLPDREFWDAMRPQYNNYLIFKYSFGHLLNDLDLYAFYPEEYGDLFKYSPTFALFMGLFYYLPDWLGLTIWNLLNMFCLYMGVRLLPDLKDKTKIFILLYVLLELIGNLQNEQSNALMTGLILLTFVSFENRKVALAALFIVLSVYIKLFGLVAAAMFLIYPRKFRFIIWAATWSLVLWLMPMLVTSAEVLIQQYSSWFEVLQADHASRYGFSLLGILNKWFGLDPSKILVLTAGVLIFCLGYIGREKFGIYKYRLLFLASILIWVILFNHTAESSGYILAMTGCGIWFFVQKPSRLSTTLIILTFIIVSLFSTDLMPAHIRNTYVYPYYVRTIPVLIIWVVVMYQLIFERNISHRDPVPQGNNFISRKRKIQPFS